MATGYNQFLSLFCIVPLIALISSTSVNQEITQYSWFVGIASIVKLKHKMGLDAIFCGGAMITTKDVITTKHCVEHSHPNIIGIITEYWLIPESDRENSIVLHNHTRSVHKIMTKPTPLGYNGPYYDIAILILVESTKIYPICLPSKTDEPILIMEKIIEFRGPKNGWTVVTIREFWVESSLAQTAYYRDKCVYNVFRNTETSDLTMKSLINVFCAGDPSGVHTTCKGDSGGPFVAKPKNPAHNGSYFVIYGLLSFGFGCHVPGNLGIYTDIRRYLDWIKHTVEAKDFC